MTRTKLATSFNIDHWLQRADLIDYMVREFATYIDINVTSIKPVSTQKSLTISLSTEMNSRRYIQLLDILVNEKGQKDTILQGLWQRWLVDPIVDELSVQLPGPSDNINPVILYSTQYVGNVTVLLSAMFNDDWTIIRVLTTIRNVIGPEHTLAQRVLIPLVFNNDVSVIHPVICDTVLALQLQLAEMEL